MKIRSVTVIALVLLLAGCAPAVPTGSTTAVTPAIESVKISISDGMQTDPVDGGRPVVLIAAALGVSTEVFREAFSGVTPAGAGNDVDEERAQQNKAALMSVLAPYGITNEQLDAASNFYRYNGSAGEIWQHGDATATAVVTDGVVTSITITNAGFGYSSVPTITLSNGQTATATVAYGTEMATNGSIASITLD